MKKVPTIVLSVSYKGVKFIDATNKVTLAAHFLWRLLWMTHEKTQAFEQASETRSVVDWSLTELKLCGVKINKV